VKVPLHGDLASWRTASQGKGDLTLGWYQVKSTEAASSRLMQHFLVNFLKLSMPWTKRLKQSISCRFMLRHCRIKRTFLSKSIFILSINPKTKQLKAQNLCKSSTPDWPTPSDPSSSRCVRAICVRSASKHTRTKTI